ncbi:MAG: hypothetical protein QOG71_3593 [Pyrinomonadaceae bacterium]|nr:hypothetical protein [Pyrinomonadaceae bacterium]
MSTIAAFILGLICGLTLYALLERAYSLGKRAGRASATPESETGLMPHRARGCCGGAHPSP